MTAGEFRELALQLQGVVEGEHMRHADFRAHGRIFATLGYPNDEWGMVKLEPVDQKRLVELHGQALSPVKGAWGLQGCTGVKLAAAKRDLVAQALDLAWQRSAAESSTKVRSKKNSAKKAVPKRAATKATQKAE